MRAALVNFYRKRTARIIPTAYLAVLVWVIGSLCWNRSGTWNTPGASSAVHAAAVSVFFVANYAELWWGVVSPIVGFWSLCVEEHFYVGYAFFRAVLRSPMARAGCLLAVIVVIQTWGIASGAVQRWPGLSHLRFDQLAAGVLLRLARDHWSLAAASWDARLRAPGAWRVAATAVLLALLVALWSLAVTWLEPPGDTSARYWAGRVLVVLVSAGLVFLASSDADLLGVRALGIGRALSALGARSYAIYMFHIPVFLAIVELRSRWIGDAHPVWRHPVELVMFLAVLGCVVELNYRWVERPAIAWAARSR